eukprot:TRINITY_DN14635_c0_g1_i1.p1 TRINITY_DN14635_c0_g1~~TRINITY_DN14635_c0_g1_i1.p1  ORF type:complete len:449 (-),score=61.11 TRINITY_DN14635_c0_g1_i1:83-1429(-)
MPPSIGKNDCPANNSWGGLKINSKAMDFIYHQLGQLSLIVICPIIVLILPWYLQEIDGTGKSLQDITSLSELLPLIPRPSIKAFGIIALFILFELLLLVILPGKQFFGPVTATGARPTYTLNAISAFIVTHLAFLAGGYFNLYSYGILYDNLTSIISSVTIFGLFFCWFLYFKGHFYPCDNDHGYSGSIITDYFWGTELYPKLFGISLKHLINCRVSMYSWSLIAISCAFKQQELFGTMSNSIAISALILVVYLFKFAAWESGYLESMDIAHDRFGFYICWGVLSWVPGFYTIAAQYFVKHPVHMSSMEALTIFGLGVFSVWVNYEADLQKQVFRATKGHCLIWGKKPVGIVAEYKTTDGQTRSSLLLASGWWGVATHFHYVPEVLVGFFAAYPAGKMNVIPYTYTIFLALLLLHRVLRDELRCEHKYGVYWRKYREVVPYKLIPYVF